MLTLLKQLGKICCVWIFFIPAYFSCFNLNAQNKLSNVSLSLDVADLTLAEVLKIITEKSAIPFSYNPKKIPVDKRIHYKAVNKPLVFVLDEISKYYALQYILVEDQVILKPERKSEKNTDPTSTFSGYIKDQRNGEALIGATVYIKELQRGTITNGFGFFSITLPKGIYTVNCSYIGFSERTANVDLNVSQIEEIKLAEDRPLLKEIVITSASQDVVKEILSSKTNVRPNAVEERPAFFGEMDVIKSLESLPGIKLHSDGSTFYYVRGGNRDQNLIIIDDAPIYNPSHMLGFFSTIIPDAVNDITLYKGNMPASLGGRLSSVLDVRTKKGNDQHREISGNIGLISTKIGIEGPIKKDESSYLLSARVSRLKWFFHRLNNNVERFNFYDLTGKVNVKLNPFNRAFFSFYTGGDNYFFNNAGIAWTNTAATLRWNHLFSDRLFMNTTVAASGYDYFLYTNVKRNTRWNSHISNFNIKSDFSYFIKPENELTFGMGLNGYVFNPGNIQSDTLITSVPTLSVKNSVEFVLYGNHEIKLSEHWGINYGLRLTSWTTTGESFEFIFDENRNPVDTLKFAKGEGYKKYANAEPRMTLSYLLNQKASIKFGLSQNVQNVHLISNSVSPFTSLEVWLPSSINIKPQLARQVTLGYYKSDFLLPDISFTAEAFYKKMIRQIDYEGHAEILLNPMLERELRFGKATAYGVELLTKKDEGRLRGWVGYTYSRAKRKFADINEGRSYNAFYDRPHQVNLMATYDISLRWNLGMNWIYTTGAPFSSPISFYKYHGEEVPIYGQKNNDRLPDYHRLDLSATLKLNKNPEKKFRHNLSFSVFNFYARKNPLFINYNKTEVSSGDYKIPSNLLEANRSTSQFYLFKFTPSISYNFKWL